MKKGSGRGRDVLERDHLHDKVKDHGGLGLLVDHDELVRGGVDLEGAVERDGGRDVVFRAWGSAYSVSSGARAVVRRRDWFKVGSDERMGERGRRKGRTDSARRAARPCRPAP